MCAAFTFQSWYLSFAKPLVLGRETKGFRLWNQGFQNLKPRLSECNSMGFRSRSPAPPKMNIYAVLGGYSLPSPAGWGWGCLFGCWRTGHGGHRPTFKHICTICSICVRLKYSTIIIRVKYYLFVLQQEVRVFTPLHTGWGWGRGC